MPYKDRDVRRAYNKAYQKKHYAKNKEYYKSKAKQTKAQQRKWNREFVNRVKKIFSCIDCGESNTLVLDFDHVKGEKVENIADMVHRPKSVSTIKEEMRKCEIRCANCHRIKTHERRSL
jgi:transcription elongation factor Elf1|tara:strand:- start:177 stop:533 length:357 start_codon:yes stop_codon:yes gene_type:complete